MPFRTIRHRSSPFHSLHSALAALSLASLLTGCATPGPPKPPSLNLPKPVADLTAERIAGNVLLRWTTPGKTTDNVAVKPPLTAEICRDSGPEDHTAKPVCTAVLKLPTQPGAAQATDPLSQPLTAGPARLLVYRVRILNGAGRSAAPSAPAFAAAGVAPPPIADLRAKPVTAGAMLEWQPQSDSAAVELNRIDLDLAKQQAAKAAAAPAPQPKPAPAKRKKRSKPAAASKPKSQSPGSQSSQSAAEVHLSATGTGSLGGTIDRTVRNGDTYTYAAQRVLTVTLDGHPLQLHSDLSTAIPFVMRDTFPPAIPSGLAAVANPASDTNKQPSIDLSWQAGTDADLAGYLVYRQTGTSGDFTRLTSTPIAAAAFSDLTAAPGQRYTYRVTAIDVSGNESRPTADVQEQLNPQNP